MSPTTEFFFCSMCIIFTIREVVRLVVTAHGHRVRRGMK